MADTLGERLTGHACADTTPVEIQVLVPVEALLDPTGNLPGEIPGHGPVPLERLLPHAQAIRRLLTRDGIIIGGDSTRRAFTGVLAEFIRARDHGRCREPYCDAPIRQLDHIRRSADSGPTSFENGRGLCQFHNQVRENPGWRAERVGHRTITTTPTGHTDESDDRNGTTAGRPSTHPGHRQAA